MVLVMTASASSEPCRMAIITSVKLESFAREAVHPVGRAGLPRGRGALLLRVPFQRVPVPGEPVHPAGTSCRVTTTVRMPELWKRR
jgi:hypothetical protein